MMYILLWASSQTLTSLTINYLVRCQVKLHPSRVGFFELVKQSFECKIPQNIGNFESQQTKDLSKNQLCGEIPLSMSNLNFLSELDFSYNNLRGEIPTSTRLQSLDASSFVGNDLFGPPLLKRCNDTCNVQNHEHDDKEGKGNGVD